MPKMNGLEVLRYIKILHIGVRRVMLTGADDLQAPDECAQCGIQRTSLSSLGRG